MNLGRFLLTTTPGGHELPGKRLMGTSRPSAALARRLDTPPDDEDVKHGAGEDQDVTQGQDHFHIRFMPVNEAMVEINPVRPRAELGDHPWTERAPCLSHIIVMVASTPP
jgi:hypothetical protein